MSDMRAEIASAQSFSFGFSERSYFIRSLLCARIWHLGQVSPPPPRVVASLHAILFTFFWSGKRAVVNRPTLQLPVRMGGWSIPDVSTICKCLALKVLIRVIRDATSFAHSLAVYFCSVQTRFLPTSLSFRDRICAERPLQLHASLVAFYRKVLPMLEDRDVLEVPAFRVSERLAVLDDAARTRLRALRCPFRSRMFNGLPGSSQDFMWLAWWGALPCLERLHRWGVAPLPTCCFCDSVETIHHVFYECRLSQVFWRHVARKFSVQCPMQWRTIRTTPRSPISRIRRLLTILGFEVLWRMRCRAVVQRRRFFPIMVAVMLLCNAACSYLACEFHALGATMFSSLWEAPEVFSVRRSLIFLVNSSGL